MKKYKGILYGWTTPDAGVVLRYVANDEPVTRLDEDVYPQGSKLTARHEHPEGIILEIEDADRLGVDITYII